ncbi:MAG: DUF1638 domain-containing protein, partial [Actinomycetota bacterium]|nr:DUF1638 domain-containing protein [Actinomycetota bacterium]
MGEDNGTARKIIACATVAEELRLMGVPEGELLELEFGLHVYPDKLRETLQGEIDAVPGEGDIVLGYGLCSNAAVGLVSRTHRIIIPRVDDCIALFLGSRREHLRRLREEPGTYFLTKGWIRAAELPINDYLRMVERYGEERALRVTRVMLANYKRVVLINTGNYRLDEFRAAARSMADTLELNYEEIPGSNRMLRAMLDGDWDSEYVIVEPGEETTLA